MVKTLDRAPEGVALRIVATDGHPTLTHRLGQLGVRVGHHVRLVQRTPGGGRVVDVAGTRVALGRDALAAVRIETDVP